MRQSKQKVLFIDSTHEILPEKFSKAGFEVLYYPNIDLTQFKTLLPEVSGLILRSRFKIDSSIIDLAKELKFIGRVGSGMENIDVCYAETKNIKCYNSPEGNSQAVAEHCLGLLLNLSKNISKSHTEIKSGVWLREANRGFEIASKTIGIIGYGNTGSKFVKLLKAFQPRILVYDKYKQDYEEEGFIETELKRVMEESDIISFHIPYNKETHNLFNNSFLSHLKKNIILLNTSRGSIVDTQAVVDGLENGKIEAVGLDVIEYEDHSFENFFSKELPDNFTKLIHSNRVIITSHIAGWTYESSYKLSAILADKILNEL